MITKEAVRQACKSQRAALSIEDCESWAAMLCDEIVHLPQYEQAQSIMVYLAMPKEANLDDVIEHALQSGKRVYVPVCVDKITMIAVRLHNLDDVVRGVLNIRVPKEPYEIIDPTDIDLVLVPGAGFDRYGGRMGMGNGYYDRFLKELSPTHYIGVAWNAQILDESIPMERYDQRMPAIVTEQGVIYVN